jgi:hypothetical protein
MKVKFKTWDLWSVVEKGGGDLREDMMALDVLSSTSSAIGDGIRSVRKDSAKEAWDVIKVMRVGDDGVRSSTTQRLLQQFENAAFRESAKDFSM